MRFFLPVSTALLPNMRRRSTPLARTTARQSRFEAVIDDPLQMPLWPKCRRDNVGVHRLDMSIKLFRGVFAAGAISALIGQVFEHIL